ncbi:hypothetical protein [Vibrio parahaemolyticus]|uniref:hypothetical protein n=1 Tax=Vibrio parahaemolyticus TaxID=670 RepID=UPI00111ED03E|nr:hypothetical protein [Vibrio parahaemolyticus]EHA1127621.1 hypothetical protein [Vibrio navarrensis]MBE3775337.1 hypothetical protein [Vibrio parahaemolyticus]MBE4462973.1 hypothetical protein [Vibrio parahaemolyticus]MDN4706345.1 hypothetical protein [Vibrio parahaemolyticus]MDN4714257.1 hypothetical protein [Vibrio parahaemolyticus]
MHWNLFSVLESDLSMVSRYIEFDERNFDTFSPELSKLLLSAGSEVDVIFKHMCARVDASAPRRNILDYYKVINSNSKLKLMLTEEIFIPRFGLSFKPFAEWSDEKRPDWWQAYNNVKHDRRNSYHQASLQSVLMSLSALMLCVLYLEKHLKPKMQVKEITSKLLPESQLLRFKDEYYYSRVVI